MDDLISRQAAIDALQEKVFHNLSDEFYGTMQVLNELPSVQPERIRGKWVNYGEGECCDQCGRYPYDDEEFHILGWRSNFCPHCGADMRGEELDETD